MMEAPRIKPKPRDPVPEPPYERPPLTWLFPARVTRIVDGDTLRLYLDLGMHRFAEEQVRLLNVDTPEMRGESREAGEAARLFVIGWLMRAQEAAAYLEWPLTVQTYRSDSFGRYLALVWNSAGQSLNEAIIEAGQGRPYEGKRA